MPRQLFVPLIVELRRGQRALFAAAIALIMLGIAYLAGMPGPLHHESWGLVGWVIGVFLSESTAATTVRIGGHDILWAGIVFLMSSLVISLFESSVLNVLFVMVMFALLIRLFISITGRPRWIRQADSSRMQATTSATHRRVAANLTVGSLLVMTFGFAALLAVGPRLGFAWSQSLWIVITFAPILAAWWFGSLLASMRSWDGSSLALMTVFVLLVAGYIAASVVEGNTGPLRRVYSYFGPWGVGPLAACSASLLVHWVARSDRVENRFIRRNWRH